MGPAILSILVVFVIVYSVVGWSLYFMQPKFVYKPVRGVIHTPEGLGLDYEDVDFKTADGVALNGWFVPAENAEFTILFCHGNGGNIMHCLDTVNIFYELGIDCFIFDYRGYGDSADVQPSEQGTYQDVEAAYRWLTETKGISPEKIIVYGRSLGGSIAAYLASRMPVKALVLESAFTSFVDTGRKFYPYMPVRLFARYSYNTREYLSKIKSPTLIFHSRDDELIPFEFGLELYESATQPCEFVEIFGSHNDGFLISGQKYKDSLVKWLKSLDSYQVQSEVLGGTS